jgi:CRISPR system Cascade subunit CasB
MVFLRRHKSDRGAMAQLRCALSPARRNRAWPLLGELDAIGDTVVETIAGLYATHPEETQTGAIGSLCRQLSAEHGTFEGRFRRLLSCSTREEVCEHLRPIVTTAKSKGRAVNYWQLFVDLQYWGDKTRVRWAREFWGREQGASDVAPSATTAGKSAT